MNEYVTKLKVADQITLERAYDLGFDCGLNGSNSVNCAYHIFRTPEHTKEWERGKADAEKQITRKF